MQTVYTAVATSTGGRVGHVRTDDGKIDMDLAIPREMGGPGGGGTNPEQLFAAAYSSCFSSSVDLVTRRDRVKAGAYTITARVFFQRYDDGTYGIAAELEGDFPDIPAEQASLLMEAAHQVCPYSRATRGNVDVALVVK